MFQSKAQGVPVREKPRKSAGSTLGDPAFDRFFDEIHSRP
jgi:hypothetical protein